MGSLYRVFPKVKYHYALKKALNKEGKSGKGENKVKKSTKEERDNSHKATSLHGVKPVRNFTLVRNFAPWCEFSHPGAKFLVIFFFHSSSAPALLLISNM